MSELALEYIEKERKEQTGKLDLRWLKLDEIPQAISQLKHLHHLSLGENYITDIKLLKDFTDLKYLDLGKNFLSDKSNIN